MQPVTAKQIAKSVKVVPQPFVPTKPVFELSWTKPKSEPDFIVHMYDTDQILKDAEIAVAPKITDKDLSVTSLRHEIDSNDDIEEQLRELENLAKTKEHEYKDSRSGIDKIKLLDLDFN